MRLVRIQGASKENARFRRHLLEAQQNWAQVNRQRKEEAERKKREETQRLTSVGLVVDRDIIMKMTVPQLKDQLKIHRQFIGDTILAKTRQKDLKTKPVIQAAVLEVRNEE